MVKVNRLVIKDCWFYNATDGFISAQECSTVKIINNYCSSFGNIRDCAGICLRVNTIDGLISGNYVTGGDLTRETPGIQCIWGVERVDILNNTVYGGQCGIETTGKYTDSFYTLCSYINVSKNICLYQTNVSIKFEQDTLVSTIEGNIVKGNRSSCPVANGIHMFSSRNCTILNNTVSNMGGSGIIVSSETGQNDNENCIISNNNVVENGSYGIFISKSNHSIVNGNLCRDNSWDGAGTADGIHIADSTDLVVTNNRCLDSFSNQNYGIASSGTSDYLCVTGNSVRNNITGGISLVGANNVNDNNIS